MSATTKNRKVVLPPPLPRPNKQRQSQCFRCWGTGKICDCCGESEPDCRCGVDGLGRPAFSDCEDCGVAGR
jgi:hypothetical protein